jgi:hypothetical protein
MKKVVEENQDLRMDVGVSDLIVEKLLNGSLRLRRDLLRLVADVQHRNVC